MIVCKGYKHLLWFLLLLNLTFLNAQNNSDQITNLAVFYIDNSLAGLSPEIIDLLTKKLEEYEDSANSQILICISNGSDPIILREASDVNQLYSLSNLPFPNQLVDCKGILEAISVSTGCLHIAVYCYVTNQFAKSIRNNVPFIPVWLPKEIKALYGVPETEIVVEFNFDNQIDALPIDDFDRYFGLYNLFDNYTINGIE